MDSYYVVLYDDKEGKLGGYDCKNEIHGLSNLHNYSTITGFIFVSAACFSWKGPDYMPQRRWFIEIDQPST